MCPLSRLFEYLHLMAESKENNYLGLLLPVCLDCDPCSVQYEALVRMETFNADSRYRDKLCFHPASYFSPSFRTILRGVGQEWFAAVENV